MFLIYPGDNSQSLDDICEKDANVDVRDIRAVFIDSTWSQAARILNDPVICNLPRISLKGRKTKFWRYQTGKSDECLATIEVNETVQAKIWLSPHQHIILFQAVYYFCVDFHEKLLRTPYQGQYDNLLFLFKFTHGKINGIYYKQTV